MGKNGIERLSPRRRPAIPVDGAKHVEKVVTELRCPG
jgi:hypothetical protein